MTEALARRILQQAIAEDRCADLLLCLFDEGSCTVDALDGHLILVSGAQISELR